MTDTIPVGEFDPTKQLDQMREIYAQIKDDLMTIITAMRNGGDPDENLKNMHTVMNNHHKAYLQVQNLEADLEKRGQLIRATRASQLDLADARSEIHTRLARFKERGGDH